jgi:hypothetical protein
MPSRRVRDGIGDGHQDGRDERRDIDCQAQAEDEDTGQYLGEVVPGLADAGEQYQPAAMTTGPRLICNRGPIRVARAPDRADSANMIVVAGSSAMPA